MTDMNAQDNETNMLAGTDDAFFTVWNSVRGPKIAYGKNSSSANCFYWLLFIFHFIVFPYSADDVQSIVSGKLALRYAGPNVDAMKSIAKASKNRSLSEFQQVS